MPRPKRASKDEAFAALARAMPSGALHGPGSAALDAASKSTLEVSQRPVALAIPADRDEIVGLIGVARRFGLVLYPYGRGKNWGYGSRLPSDPGAVLLSLERLNAISDHDETLGTVRVEAGVRFQDLAADLAARRFQFLVNTPGSSAAGSVIGHALERGFVQGQMPDRAEYVTDIEAILGTGETVRLGAGGFRGSNLGAVLRAGPGADASGLLFQSGGAIVTAATIWLPLQPAHHASFVFKLRRGEALADLIEALRGLKQDGTITAPIGLFSAARVASMIGGYPFRRHPDGRRLRQDTISEIVGSESLWFGQGGLAAGSAALLSAQQSHVAERLSLFVRELSFTSDPSKDPFHSPEQRTDASSLWWRVRRPEEKRDPDDEPVGAIWVAPAVPLRGRDIRRAIELAEDGMSHAGFEPVLSLQLIKPQLAYLLSAILYDQSDFDEAQRATRCQHRLTAAFCAEGYLPYRVPLGDLTDFPAMGTATSAFLRRLRHAIDPDKVISPSRYRLPEM